MSKTKQIRISGTERLIVALHKAAQAMRGDSNDEEHDALLHLVRAVNTLPAKVIARYFKIYRNFLCENNLDDDSSAISLRDLIGFVEEEIENPDEYDND